MADQYVDKVANELADMALADQKRTGDIGIVDVIGDVLGASSQTLQETYLTAVRVRRAEERARALLAERASKPVVPDAELIENKSDVAEAEPVEDAEIMPEDVSDTAADSFFDKVMAEEEPPEPSEPARPALGMPRRVMR